MSVLKQSTAATIKFGPFIDDTDGKTAETALTISQADIRLSKNGGDFIQTNNAAGATHDESGYYDVPLDTTDTNTLGRLRVAVSESGALPVWQDFIVVTANVYDSLCSTDKLDVNTAELGGTAQTGNDVGADVNEIKAKTDLITTGTSLTIASQVSGSTITVPRGDTLSASLMNIGDLTNYSKLWFTVKSDESDADDKSLIQIEKTAGLLYINKAVATVPTNGSLTINDEPTGDVTITLAAVELAKLSPGQYHYDIQILRSTGIAVSTLTSDTFIIPADYTRAVA